MSAPDPMSRLTQALADYQTTLARADYVALREAADVCGRPDGEPPLTWAKVRVETYRDQMAGGFVGRVG